MAVYTKKTCDLSDCFANKEDKCRLLSLSIYYDCPFYKPVMDGDGKKMSIEDFNEIADAETFVYAETRIEMLTNEIEELNEKLAQKKRDLSEARKERTAAKNRIQKKIQKERS